MTDSNNCGSCGTVVSGFFQDSLAATKGDLSLTDAIQCTTGSCLCGSCDPVPICASEACGGDGSPPFVGDPGDPIDPGPSDAGDPGDDMGDNNMQGG